MNFQFPVYFAIWIGMGMMGIVLGSITVHRAERRARHMVAEAQLVQTQRVEAELVSAA